MSGTPAVLTDTDREVECTDIQSLIITTGEHHGDIVTAHSCAAPNVIIGHCYQASIRDYTYDPACTDGSARFDRIVRGVQDTEVCEVPTEDVGRRMDMILIGKSTSFTKRRTRPTVSPCRTDRSPLEPE
ncbi:hypothetical protein [Nocardia cyriacigeorgica]|uniref:hypothetical protein n=1 Tax=Nocardia cyriacigeorgica TaxID=135487 RepID=UPI0034DB1FE9